MQTIEIQKGIRVGFEDLVNGVSRLETSDLEKLADTVNHILDGRKNPSPAAREQELLEEIEHVVPEFIRHRYNRLHAKLQKEKILETEHQELLQIVDFMEERALVRVHLMAELAALRQVSLKEVGEQLRKRRHGHAEA
ncbi:MAG: hypothetical protein SH848_01895 [Saprospiraceae bacterium]|nr:hypothetical protein [Saprospiraceae bacterium]MDZ4702649.1 hypothetical protein [Saprospiraceae bacterium]